MLKWTKEILLVLAEKVSPKHAFILLFTCLFCTAGYFILDRVLDYEEAIDLNKPKRVIERPESSVPEFVEYKDKTLHGYTAEQSK